MRSGTELSQFLIIFLPTQHKHNNNNKKNFNLSGACLFMILFIFRQLRKMEGMLYLKMCAINCIPDAHFDIACVH